MEIHINEILNLVEELTALGQQLEDHLVSALILCSLPDSYSTLITALETRPAEDLTLGLVKNKLLEEYNGRKDSIEVQMSHETADPCLHMKTDPL